MSTLWIRRLFARKPVPARTTRKAAPLALRALEDRLVPSFGTPILNFNSSTSPFNPPDCIGDVGPDQYVSMYNTSGGHFGTVVNIYNKDGTPIVLDEPLETIPIAPGGNIGGAGTPQAGAGDPIIGYDHFNNRWVLGEINQNADGLSLYVSTTSDATGPYFHYEFSMPLGPDYPKLGITQDGYFIGTNEDDGPIYAFNAAKMIAGQPLGANDLQRPTAPVLAGHGFQVMTPADVDGVAGPAGISFFMRKNDDEINAPAESPPKSANPNNDFLEVWACHIDFTSPGNTTYTQIANIPVAEFDSLFNDPNTFSAIPQPGGGRDLDPINEPVMNRPA